MSKITFREYPSNVVVFSNQKGKEFYVDIHTDGLSISRELAEDPETDDYTIVENWIDYDIERIEEDAERKLDEDETREIRENLSRYYYNRENY